MTDQDWAAHPVLIDFLKQAIRCTCGWRVSHGLQLYVKNGRCEDCESPVIHLKAVCDCGERITGILHIYLIPMEESGLRQPCQAREVVTADEQLDAKLEMDAGSDWWAKLVKS